MNVTEMIMQEHMRFNAAVEEWVRAFMLSKYGAEKDEDVVELMRAKRIALAYSSDGMIFYGVTLNNRWLYAVDGKVVGKIGKRFKLEEVWINGC